MRCVDGRICLTRREVIIAPIAFDLIMVGGMFGAAAWMIDHVENATSSVEERSDRQFRDLQQQLRTVQLEGDVDGRATLAAP